MLTTMATFKRRVAMLLVSMALLGLALPLTVPVASAAGSTRLCYLIDDCNQTVYKDKNFSTRYGTVFPTDEIRVISVTDAYCVISYRVPRGWKTGYVPTKCILLNTTGSRVKATKKIPTFRRPGAATYGYVSEGDVITILGYTNSGYIQIKYPVSRGYKYAFIKADDLGSANNASASSNNTLIQPDSRLQLIAQGKLSRNGSTVLQVGKTFRGTLSNEQCKGYAKNVYVVMWNVMPSSTKAKPYNYLLNGSSMKYVGTASTASEIKTLLLQGRSGSFLQMRRNHGGSHSAILYSANNDFAYFLEANADGKNTIQLKAYSWSTLASQNQKISLYY